MPGSQRCVCVSFCEHSLGGSCGAAPLVLPHRGLGWWGHGLARTACWDSTCFGHRVGMERTQILAGGSAALFRSHWPLFGWRTGSGRHPQATSKPTAWGSQRHSATSAHAHLPRGWSHDHMSILPASGGFPHPRSKICRLAE